MFFLRQKIEKGMSCAWQSTSIKARQNEKQTRRESSEFKDQFNIAEIFVSSYICQYFVERTCFVYDGLSV